MGVLRQDAGQKNPLELTSGQLADLGVCVVEQVDALQGMPDRLSVLGPRPTGPADAGIAPHHHDVRHGHRERPLDLVELRKVAHHGALRVRVGVMKEDSSAQDRDQTEDRFEEGGLAGAVGADDADHLPGPDSEGDPLDGGVRPVSCGQISDLQAVVPG